MKVKRIDTWLRSGGDGGPVYAGEECEMPDDLARIHIKHGSAVPADAPFPQAQPSASTTRSAGPGEQPRPETSHVPEPPAPKTRQRDRA